MVRSEHHADAGQHRVELAAVERECLGIGLRSRSGRGPAWRELSDGPLASRSGHRSLAITLAPANAAGIATLPAPAADIEHPVADADPAGLYQHWSQRSHHFGGHDRVVAQCPQGAVLSAISCRWSSALSSIFVVIPRSSCVVGILLPVPDLKPLGSQSVLVFRRQAVYWRDVDL